MRLAVVLVMTVGLMTMAAVVVTGACGWVVSGGRVCDNPRDVSVSDCC